MSTCKNDYAWDIIVTYRGSHVLYHNVLHVLFLDVDYQSNLHPNTINNIIVWQTALKLTMPLVRKKITSYRQSCLRDTDNPFSWKSPSYSTIFYISTQLGCYFHSVIISIMRRNVMHCLQCLWFEKNMLNKRPMGHVSQLRKQFNSVNTLHKAIFMYHNIDKENQLSLLFWELNGPPYL